MTRLRPLLGSAVLEIVLVALCLFLAAVAPNFLTAENLLNVLRNVSMQGLIALGMTLVIIAGEIDLSVGSMVAFSGCLTAWLTGHSALPGRDSPSRWLSVRQFSCHLPPAVCRVRLPDCSGTGSGSRRS